MKEKLKSVCHEDLGIISCHSCILKVDDMYSITTEGIYRVTLIN